MPLVVVTLQLRGLATDSHIPALRIRHKTLELGAADDAALAVNSDGGGPPQAQQLQAGDAAKPKSVLEKLVREPQLGEQRHTDILTSIINCVYMGNLAHFLLVQCFWSQGISCL